MDLDRRLGESALTPACTSLISEDSDHCACYRDREIGLGRVVVDQSPWARPGAGQPDHQGGAQPSGAAPPASGSAPRNPTNYGVGYPGPGQVGPSSPATLPRPSFGDTLRRDPTKLVLVVGAVVLLVVVLVIALVALVSGGSTKSITEASSGSQGEDQTAIRATWSSQEMVTQLQPALRQYGATSPCSVPSKTGSQSTAWYITNTGTSYSGSLLARADCAGGDFAFMVVSDSTGIEPYLNGYGGCNFWDGHSFVVTATSTVSTNQKMVAALRDNGFNDLKTYGEKCGS